MGGAHSAPPTRADRHSRHQVRRELRQRVGSRSASIARLMAGLFVDTKPLRVSRDFRLLFVGQAVSYLGAMITMAALPYQVFHATHSSVDVGLLGLAQLGPMLFCGL